MNKFLINHIHLLSSSHKKIMIDLINVSLMMQNDDLIFLISEYCDIESHMMLRKTCKRFYQLIKPLTIDEAFRMHLIEVESGLMQLVDLMDQKYGVDNVEIEECCGAYEIECGITVIFVVDTEHKTCEFVCIDFLSGAINVDDGSIFDVTKMVKRSKNFTEKYGTYNGFEDILFKSLGSIKPKIDPKVAGRKKLFTKYYPDLDVESYITKLNQMIQSLLNEKNS